MKMFIVFTFIRVLISIMVMFIDVRTLVLIVISDRYVLYVSVRPIDMGKEYYERVCGKYKKLSFNHMDPL